LGERAGLRPCLFCLWSVIAYEVMKGQLIAATPAEYISQLVEPRKTEVAALDAMIRKVAPQLKPFVHIGILAYGPRHTQYASGREGDWFRIGVSSNKNYISLYVSAGDECGSIAERYKEALPKASIGKCCVRFKRLSDLDEGVLKQLIRDGAGKAAKA
jgi:hypothetical protein